MQTSELEVPPMPYFRWVWFPRTGEGSFDCWAESIWKDPLFSSGAGIRLRNNDGNFESIYNCHSTFDLIWLSPCGVAMRVRSYCHFKGEELESQRGAETCLRSHSLAVGMCGSSFSPLVHLNKHMYARKWIKSGAFAQGIGEHCCGSQARAWRGKGRTQLWCWFICSCCCWEPRAGCFLWSLQDEHDLNQTALACGQTEATLCSPWLRTGWVGATQHIFPCTKPAGLWETDPWLH